MDGLPHRLSFLAGQGNVRPLVNWCPSYYQTKFLVAFGDDAVPYARGVDVLMRSINHFG